MSETKKPTRYELISKDGNVVREFDSAYQAAIFAAQFFPDQEQDPDETGAGWNIRLVGADQ